MATKYTEEVLREAVENSTSVMGMIRYMGLKQAGGTHTHLKRMLSKYNIDTSHFTGRVHNKGKPALNRKTPEQILVYLPEGSARAKRPQLHRAMLESGVEYRCKLCGLTDSWQGDTLRLEIDHIDGEWLNNRLDNLRFLCPNCHSQTPTSVSWKNKSK